MIEQIGHNSYNALEDSPRIFDDYLHLVNVLCAHLRETEGVSCEALPESQESMVKAKFFSLPFEVQKHRYEMFHRYFTVCHEITTDDLPLRDKQKTLFAFFRKYGLSTPNAFDVFELIDKDTYVEVYDEHFTQVFRSVDFLEVTSHGLMTLETCEWFDLFERAESITKDQMDVVQKIYSGAITNPVFKPIEDHVVKEINSGSPKTSKSESLVYAPVHDSKGEFFGGLHLFKVQEQRSLDFEVV